MSISEFYYYETFEFDEIQDAVRYLNDEQKKHGRIIEIDAEEIQLQKKIFVIRRIKFDNSKQSFNILHICHKKLMFHLKINDCDFGLFFDLTTHHPSKKT